MSEAEAFRDLMGRVRSGDDQAAEELVRRYEPTIRVAIRVRLDQSDLRRLFDSMDVCQSVMANFFVRAASGQFELDKPEQLVKLLVTMARNKLVNYVHHQQAGRRDSRRQVNFDTTEVAESAPTPSQVATYRELLEAVRCRLSEEEQRLADLRGAGRSWPEIAAEVGENADALRFRLTRALDRVTAELRLDD
jgi:RNA polymerase sigma-70 factor (ECF subfamily)